VTPLVLDAACLVLTGAPGLPAFWAHLEYRQAGYRLPSAAFRAAGGSEFPKPWARSSERYCPAASASAAENVRAFGSPTVSVPSGTEHLPRGVGR
jgi:hypothetical protein